MLKTVISTFIALHIICLEGQGQTVNTIATNDTSLLLTNYEWLTSDSWSEDKPIRLIAVSKIVYTDTAGHSLLEKESIMNQWRSEWDNQCKRTIISKTGSTKNSYTISSPIGGDIWIVRPFILVGTMVEIEFTSFEWSKKPKKFKCKYKIEKLNTEELVLMRQE